MWPHDPKSSFFCQNWPNLSSNSHPLIKIKPILIPNKPNFARFSIFNAWCSRCLMPSHWSLSIHHPSTLPRFSAPHQPNSANLPPRHHWKDHFRYVSTNFWCAPTIFLTKWISFIGRNAFILGSTAAIKIRWSAVLSGGFWVPIAQSNWVSSADI